MIQGESLYKAIFECSQDGIFVCRLTKDNLPGRFIEVNARMCEQLGYTRAELLELTPLDLVDEAHKLIFQFRNKLVDEKQILFEVECKTKCGNMLPVEIKAHILELDGQPLFIGIGRNILARREAEQAYRLYEVQNKVLIDALPDSMFRLTREGFIIHARTGAETKWLISNHQIIGKNISDILPRRVASLTIRRIEGALYSKNVQTYEYHLPLNGRHRIWEVRMVISGANEVLAIVRDITERKRQERRLKYLSLHDSLTGIYNRAFIEQEMFRIQQEGKGPVGIIMCDVDRLKHINDTLGHSSGDNLLVAAANVIKKAVRKGDVVARIGGDEFAILLPRGDLAAARQIYRRIQEGASRHNAENPELPVSMSVGYAACSNNSLSMADLLREADLNMYQEKMLRCKVR